MDDSETRPDTETEQAETEPVMGSLETPERQAHPVMGAIESPERQAHPVMGAIDTPRRPRRSGPSTDESDGDDGAESP